MHIKNFFSSKDTVKKVKEHTIPKTPRKEVKRGLIDPYVVQRTGEVIYDYVYLSLYVCMYLFIYLSCLFTIHEPTGMMDSKGLPAERRLHDFPGRCWKSLNVIL